jgi:hypothetical protein
LVLLRASIAQRVIVASFDGFITAFLHAAICLALLWQGLNYRGPARAQASCSVVRQRAYSC